MAFLGLNGLDFLKENPSILSDGSIITKRSDFYISDDELAVLYDTDNEILYKNIRRKYKLESAVEISPSGARLISAIAVFFAEILIIVGLVMPLMSSSLVKESGMAGFMLAAVMVIVPALAIISFVRHLSCKNEMKKAVDEGNYYVYNCKVLNKSTKVVRSRHGSTTYYYLTLDGGMVNVKGRLYGMAGIGGMIRCVIVNGEQNRYLLLIDN